jgi:hypothetical protein
LTRFVLVAVVDTEMRARHRFALRRQPVPDPEFRGSVITPGAMSVGERGV